jgi:2-oxoglutarate dehydrogenase E2 component (dihydrolipoamide succinyltransferase)
MLIEVKVPVLAESVAEATLLAWHKQPGDYVARDENLIDVETDKVVMELPAPQAGVLKTILKHEGDTVVSDEVIAMIDTDAKPTSEAKTPSKAAAAKAQPAKQETASKSVKAELQVDAKPAAAVSHPAPLPVAADRLEQRVPMSRLRARVAERLVQSQHAAAILTTFNEVNMKPVIDLRSRYKDQFEKEHGIKLGFMSFFVKAAVVALKKFPIINASIDGNDIIYHGYFDIGIAVASANGLVVPIIRNADRLSMAEIEKQISEYGKRAQERKLTVEELSGGTFTISNGGVFGSMLSTPIINPPQSAILGVHAIKERAVVENGQIVIRPINYLALSYDHRIIDGREAVLCLGTIKEALEDPARTLLDV